MNPYAPPLAISNDPRVAIKNPARFLLYASAAICIFGSLAIGFQFLSQLLDYGITLTTVDFLEAGIGVLEMLFGTSASFLATHKLSKKTRMLTILWSLAAASIIVTSMIVTYISFETPIVAPDLIALSLILLLLLFVAVLSFRSVPSELCDRLPQT